MAEHFPAPWHVDPLTASIYASDVPKGPARVADMRGWGYLTGKGHGALALSQDEAIDIQRANAAFLVKAVNNHDHMVQTLEALRDDPATPPWIQTLARGTLDRVGSPEVSPSDCEERLPREPFKECEYPKCNCPRYGRCGNAVPNSSGERNSK